MRRGAPPQPTKSMGSITSSPVGLAAEPQPKTVLLHFQLEETHLMATNFVFFFIFGDT